MAKKVFRIHNGAEGSGWFVSNRPAARELRDVRTADGNGKLATSIPSPFARIDLVKNAFDAIGASRQIKGTTNNHKLISDALDVAQLFFYFKKVKNKYPNAEIIAWNPAREIESSLNNPVTNLFGRTLDLFWKQDEEPFNFNRANHLFILRIDFKVVGATSPATMFFAAQDVEKYNFDFNFDNVRLFDNNFESIIERDDAFIKFMYAAYRTQSFAHTFPELYQYLNVALAELQRSNYNLWNEIQAFNQDTLYTDFMQLNTGDIPPVEVCGIPVCNDEPNPQLIPQKSGFTINGSRSFGEGELPPLVLPTEKFFLPWIYTNNVWDPETKVPEYDELPLEQRILPGQADQYPYLTISDFLEDKLFELPFNINGNKYSNFGFENYLLPLKPSFFKYFDVDDINGKRMISVDTTTPNAVRVHLNIPTASGMIEYKKVYTEEQIFQRSMHFGMFPILKDSIGKMPVNYHFGVIDYEKYNNQDIDLELYNEGQLIDSEKITKVVRLEKKSGEGSYNYKYKGSFNVIRVISDNDVNGIIIPDLLDIAHNGSKARVAIDFGTTNTHIEYKYDGGLEKAFDLKGIYASLSQGSDMLGRSTTREHTLEMEVFPKEMGADTSCKFPLRTALLENHNTNWSATPSIFQNSNIGYYYEKRPEQQHHNIITDLKWNNLNNSVEKLKVVHFVEGLLEGIKYKLLADGVALHDATIKWLYPVSMTMNQRMLLGNIWQDALINTFGEQAVVESIPESIAPYTYYNHEMGLMGLTASIDIGGGTSDIAVFEQQNPKMISSVGFAGNAVVGDAYNSSLKINGFYQAFARKFQHACDNKDGSLQKSIFTQIVNGRKPDSSNFNSFLFSVDKQVFDYSEELRLHPTMKFNYLIFYAAQAFYLANLMKLGGSEIPKNIIFSGSGSKSIDIIDQDRHNHALTKMLFDFFFNEIYGVDIANIKIMVTPNPKEITCKGALLSEPINLKEKIGFWLGGKDECNKVYYESDTNKPDYIAVNQEEFKNDVLCSVQYFFELFDKYVLKNNLSDNYGVDNSAMTVFKEIRETNLKEYLEKGISEKLKAAQGPESAIAEGLFFYPLVGIINNLATELSQKEHSEREVSSANY
ncbi:cell division protein FtsA [Marinifilum fragile]|uniref:cell division protein FtsA n=1 Tax=Marinifilum fragile TaxID=570161 RepID=UPI002AA83446|nr:cell division protein FtsA [Marinifilum fragile]